MSPRRSYAERYRLMRSRWNEEWWSVAMGGPIGNVLNAVIADVSWVTPNAITLVGFVAKLIFAPLILLGDRGADLIAIALLQVSVICDCMDGSLARYRKTSSYLGAFLDKITDALGYAGIFAAFGWRVYVDTGDAAAIVAALAIPLSLLIRAYVYWVVGSMQKLAGVAQTTGVDTRVDYSRATFAERARMYVRSMPRIIEFNESDLFFWLGLAIALGGVWMRYGIYFLAIATGVIFIGIMIKRFAAVLRLERERKPT
ncbi:MAG: CDP-alcohol phosphatidyltransferase family protein [Deltaproteobacteria bacterium]|nr:CDP-alcohol phosphatidyltransferase family protein [Deltaproteobacteria bacterium]